MEKLLKASILSISMITVMAGAAVSPALANISNAFPSASASLIKMILTLPALFIIFFSLVSGKLTYIFSKKQVLIIGLLIYIVGGVGPIFINDLRLLLVFRAILGLGCGLIMPISQSLIVDFFSDDERVKMTGYSSAASNFMGMISSIIVGSLSAVNWKYGFYIYFIALIVLILNISALPKQESERVRRGKEFNFNKKVYLLAGGMCLITMAFYAVPTNIAFFMKKEHIGTSSSSGVAIAVFTLGGFIAGIILSDIRKRLKNYVLSSGIGIMALGYGLLLYCHNLFILLVSVALVGFSFGMIYPLIFLKTSNISDKDSISISMSVVSSSMFLGQFLSPIVLQYVSRILNNNTTRFNFGILAICLSVAFVISLILQAKNKIYNRNVTKSPI